MLPPTVGAKKVYVQYLRYVCSTKKKTTFELIELLPHFVHTFTIHLYFVEFTTRMNKNTDLLFLFAVLAFRFALFFSLYLSFVAFYCRTRFLFSSLC